MYYLRSRAAADAIKFTVDTSVLKVKIHPFYSLFQRFFHIHADRDNSLEMSQEKVKPVNDIEAKMAQVVCSLENREECMACGS